VELPKSIEESVARRQRIDAEDDFQSGSVTEMLSGPSELTARVHANGNHTVHLSRADSGIACECSCHDFRTLRIICRHVWAVLLAAQSSGMLQGWEPHEGDRLVAHGQDSDEDDSDSASGGPINERRIATQSNPLTRKTDWRSHLTELRDTMLRAAPLEAGPGVPDLQVWYVVDLQATVESRGIILELIGREPKREGVSGKDRPWSIDPETIPLLPDQADRDIISRLHGASTAYSEYYDTGASDHRFHLRKTQAAILLEAACKTGRCVLRTGSDEADLPMQWDNGPAWTLHLHVEVDEAAGRYVLRGDLRREGEILSLDDAPLITPSGLLFTRTHIARLNDRGGTDWVRFLRRHNTLSVPSTHADDLIKQLMELPQLPPLNLPEALRPEVVSPQPKPRLRIEAPRHDWEGPQRLIAHLVFDYDGTMISMHHTGSGLYQAERRRLVMRDTQFESGALSLLLAMGFRVTEEGDARQLSLPPRILPAAVRRLTEADWHVEAEGKLYRQSGRIKIEVSSGIDWFELHGEADFDGQTIQLPKLLTALRKGEKTILLGDGSLGVLPEQWLKQYGALAGMGTEEEEHLRFARTQIGLLDALLATQPEATCDEVFQNARKQLLDFSGIEASDAPGGFVGTLRPYQRDGLGWMRFLRDFRFGGCLADDMGLGKTVQVLALLEERRERGEAEAATNGHGLKTGLSLVVVPRSLIFNWMEEAARFSPKLRVLDHTGLGRGKSADAFAGYDLVLTTYGTLRNDIDMMRAIHFDYVILDEAQAIKNAASGSAKAVRLLQGEYRLALSGTPVQNHLGELWSLFEFLNPGMLGTARAFEAAGTQARVVEQETREVLSRALRPFILRRTKGQVARELPARIEQTIHCELEGAQRKLYDDLRDHYRQSLLARIEKEGINKAKIQILEALLRLRQVACHPGLIDKANIDQPSAKIDALIPQLAEVVEENHKVLVFSQFTSLLAIVRTRLDREGLVYEYLDGKTRDRAERVRRFQTDENCKIFLISLKAGGLGLNLTAAEYVFLLDPWWNPAVEAQAIDRAHRIGQSRQVFAYRLIAKDTVEEKVVQLQATKRELADAIINADNSIISTLGKDDLQLLLS
jgi:superfamily II DNA or RNA helicase